LSDFDDFTAHDDLLGSMWIGNWFVLRVQR